MCELMSVILFMMHLSMECFVREFVVSSSQSPVLICDVLWLGCALLCDDRMKLVTLRVRCSV